MDLTCPPILAINQTAVHVLFESNYGSEYSEQKMDALYELIFEEGWSGKRLEAVAKWILKNLKWAAWTAADWFNAPSESLYNYAWMVDEVHKDHTAAQRMERYRVNGVYLYRYADGTQLPFEKDLTWNKAKKQEEPKGEPGMTAETRKELYSQIGRPEPEANEPPPNPEITMEQVLNVTANTLRA